VVALARERHFGRAAQACFVSQPTLSVALRRLEEELGVTLFERGRSEVVLTPLGERIVEQAQRVLEEAAMVRKIAESGKDPFTGPLRLGAIHTIGPYLLPHLIPVLTERAPHMPLLVEENYTAALRERLKQGELDIIIVSLPLEEPGIVLQPLYDEPFVVLLPASHPWNEREGIQVEDLSLEPVLLLGPGHCFRDQVLQVCPECLQSGRGDGGLQKALEGSSLETIRHMVASGVGVTVLPCTAAAADQYSRRLLNIRRFADVRPRRRVALAWRRNFPRPQVVEVLHQAILSCPLTCVERLNLAAVEASRAR
jgi:LysR family hydrogen peroxide-inducible transcriptional activator